MSPKEPLRAEGGRHVQYLGGPPADHDTVHVKLDATLGTGGFLTREMLGSVIRVSLTRRQASQLHEDWLQHIGETQFDGFRVESPAGEHDPIVRVRVLVPIVIEIEGPDAG